MAVIGVAEVEINVDADRFVESVHRMQDAMALFVENYRRLGIIPPHVSGYRRGDRWESIFGIRWRLGGRRGREMHWIRVGPKGYRIRQR